ncbi:hypothetical protein [Acrocarpospora sp. B8E8]|uniref:hypothetical protein n=1 Tax=Acrocarpospora sp. B8E8 TaxID=3153572 RepID=UPI00325D5F4E
MFKKTKRQRPKGIKPGSQLSDALRGLQQNTTTTTQPGDDADTPGDVGLNPTITTTLTSKSEDDSAERSDQEDGNALPFRPRAQNRNATNWAQAPLSVKKTADHEFIANEYYTFYDATTGTHSDAYLERKTDLYSSMSKFDGEYLKKPIHVLELAKYCISGLERNLYTLEAQNWDDDYDSALKGADYFHFRNKNVRSAPYNGIARRIVLNTKSQQLSMKMVDALIPLLEQGSDVRDFILNFKAFLGDTPLEEIPKADKIVIYYNPDGSDPRNDRVGNRIINVIIGTISRGDIDPRLAPFYETIVDGLGWADEQGGASFTTIRQMVMEQVVKENPFVTDEEEFYTLVMQKFAQMAIDPSNTHQVAQKNPMPGPKIT